MKWRITLLSLITLPSMAATKRCQRVYSKPVRLRHKTFLPDPLRSPLGVAQKAVQQRRDAREQPIRFRYVVAQAWGYQQVIP